MFGYTDDLRYEIEVLKKKLAKAINQRNGYALSCYLEFGDDSCPSFQSILEKLEFQSVLEKLDKEIEEIK